MLTRPRGRRLAASPRRRSRRDSATVMPQIVWARPSVDAVLAPVELARIDWSWLRFAPFTGTGLIVVAATVGPNPGALLTALAASAALAVVATVALREFVLAPAEAALRVGHRARAHRESLDRIAAPAHPDTAGRVRSRAPGGVAPAV